MDVCTGNKKRISANQLEYGNIHSGICVSGMNEMSAAGMRVTTGRFVIREE